MYSSNNKKDMICSTPMFVFESRNPYDKSEATQTFVSCWETQNSYVDVSPGTPRWYIIPDYVGTVTLTIEEYYNALDELEDGKRKSGAV